MRRLAILTLIISYLHGLAQEIDEKNFKHFTIKNGLSNNYVTGIEQDLKGYIWISTSRGLNRFDGNLFKQFLHTSEANSLPDNDIYSISMLNANQLSVATDDGAQIINTETLEAKNLEIPTEEALRYWSNSCKFISCDSNGNLGVSTKTGFYIFSAAGDLKKRYDRYTVKDVGHAWMMFGNRVFRLPDGNMMQLNKLGLFVYDRRKNLIADVSRYYPGLNNLSRALRTVTQNIYFISSTRIIFLNYRTNSFDVVDIRDGNTRAHPACINLIAEAGWQTKLVWLSDQRWVLTSGEKGFYILNIDTATGNVNCNRQKYFPNRFCNVIFCDHEKRLWVGTDEGVFAGNTSRQIVTTFHPDMTNGNENITSVFVSADHLITGTDKNRILIREKKTAKTNLVLIPDKRKDVLNIITAFIRVHPDTLWIATTSGLYWVHLGNYSMGKVFDDQKMANRFYKDRDGIIWIAPYYINCIFRYDPVHRKLDTIDKQNNPLLNINVVTSFAEDKFGNMWIGGDAIARWNHKLNKIDTLVERIATQKNRKKGFITMNDSKGEIWTTINDDGFAKLTGPPLHIRPENVIPENYAQGYPGLFSDKIFLATVNGIGCVDLKGLQGIIFDKSDGATDELVTSSEFAFDPTDSSVWFASKKTICRIAPFFNTKFFEPVLLSISEVSILNNSVINYPPTRVTLKYFQNDLKIVLTAVNYRDPENMRFAYRFKNENDTNWTDMGTQQSILLTNISPGRYILQAKVYSYNNNWPEQSKEIVIVIKPPFWKTIWFFLAFGMITAAGVYTLYRARVKRIHQKANLDRLLAQTEMKALHSQMNPHFIFNCLNSIREMILNNENMQASHYLSKFAQLIRITLDNSTKPFISLENTLDYLQRYLEMEEIRTDNFSYSIEVDPALEPGDIFLPPMLIQPFVENAIWHGQVPEKPMQLFIRFLKRDGDLVCIIEDDGIGIEASLKNKHEINHHSVGISNIRQRIQLLNEKYDLRSTVTVEDRSMLMPRNGTGTKVTLHLPVKNVES